MRHGPAQCSMVWKVIHALTSSASWCKYVFGGARLAQSHQLQGQPDVVVRV